MIYLQLKSMNELERIDEIKQGFDKIKEDLNTLSAIENLNQSIQNQIEEKINDLNKVVVQFNENPEELVKNTEILANFEQELKKIQEETIKLKEKINKETKNEMNNLSEDIETTRYKSSLTTYNELIKLDNNEDYGENPLNQRLLKVMSSPELANTPELKDKTPEERVEYFFEKINTALIKFYENKLISKEGGEVPEHISKALVPATEIYLLNFLKHNQNENNIGALGLAGEISRNSLNSLIDGISGIANKYTYSYSSMKSLLNIADFLSLPQHQHHLKKLDNPYLLYQKVFVEKSNIWSQEKLNIQTLSLTDAGLGFLLDQDSEETALAQETETIKENIKQEIQGIKMVETPETALKILGLIKKADDVLNQTGKLSNNLLETTKNFYKIDESLRKYFGLNLFDVINEAGWVKDVLDFALSLLGFSGGIKGLEAKFRRGNIENHLSLERRKFISDTYKDYFDNKNKSESARESGEIISNLKTYNVPQNILENLKKKENNIINKLDLDHTQLKSSILEQLEDTNLINVGVLESLPNNIFNGKNYLKKEKDKNGNEVNKIDQNAVNNDPKFKENFVDVYLNTTVNHIIKDDKYLEKINNSDELAFTLISGVVVGEDNMIEGVKADAIFPSEFYETPYLNTDVSRVDISDSTESSLDINPEWGNVKNKKLNTLSHSEAIIVLESIFGKGPGTDLLIKLSNGSPIMIGRVIALARHEGGFKFGRKNDDKNKGQINIGTFQISAQHGEIVDKRNRSLDAGIQLLENNNIEYSNNYFTTIKDYNDETAIGNNDLEILIKKAQTDLVVWLGYVKRRGGGKYFDRLNDSKENEEALMPEVQIGENEIGTKVVEYLNTTSQNLVRTSQMKDDYKEFLA